MTSTFHTKGQFLDFCTKVFGNYTPRNSGANIEVVCPKCKKKKGNQYRKQKLAIETETHVLHCWVCGYKSINLCHLLKIWKPHFYSEYCNNYLSSEARAREQSSESEQQEVKEKKIVTLPEGFALLATADSNDAVVRASLNYLKARGVDPSQLWYWRLGIVSGDRKLYRRILVPSFDERGIINYYSARSIDKNPYIKYVNPEADREDIIFNEINIDWNEELTIVEGVFDLMKCNDNATCILSSELPPHFKLFEKILEHKTPVVLALDPEERDKTVALAKQFLEYDIKVKILDLKENQEDVGALTKSEFIELLQCAKIFDKEKLLRRRISSII